MSNGTFLKIAFLIILVGVVAYTVCPKYYLGGPKGSYRLNRITGETKDITERRTYPVRDYYAEEILGTK